MHLLNNFLIDEIGEFFSSSNLSREENECLYPR